MAKYGTNNTGTSTSHASITRDQLDQAIRKKAQELYEKSGRKPGRDMENWLEAERIVKRQAGSS